MQSTVVDVRYIKCLSHVITVEYVQHVSWDGSPLGQCNFQQCHILINTSAPSTVQDSSLLHELLHFIEGTNGLELEEKQICALEVGLYDLIVNNKELIQSFWRDDDV